ncbi:virB8 family protein [Amaricoccus solimangrovi]|uniref:Type IV secretion system protein n=1 Tax=Amaricoccus solimangrovi TaxID=2589815 RepID=A0A501WER2_9RHOB|nr:type IV secretion system protein [Amaricoccus solimangrovi]TPE47312.1 type IV secretion system protein [Amaricoccus solimangrovi]
MPSQADPIHRFEDEVFFGLRRRATLLGWMAGTSIAIAACATGALLLALPLKEVRPYVVMVDRATGESELVVSTLPGDLAERDAVRQAELVRYVTERETYDNADNATRIPEVLAGSEGQAADSLRGLWSSGADQYPPALYGAETLIRVVVRSVTVLNDATAQIRFTRKLEQPGLPPVSRAFVATVGFAFRPRTERTLEAVWQNPLGFTVTS